ncbi:mitochondrial matrix Mmp37-domain-containing protein [Lipomyces tetrasporus]|uniref:Phosphatidate cytidylyltransferase, mitochondrial n=1 Tax=Lipomyces tetrasporus TaxID=54092 RepID=A0AAD7QX36_9ASCO|nr:mitochondrial matrix Mmp37-domain-containing protein [Lipomyces tetrasporus]KAJ8103069.1 mitochondrial matrix Mmp37-domain-containing protein [Lipomyces tetrasporus]
MSSQILRSSRIGARDVAIARVSQTFVGRRYLTGTITPDPGSQPPPFTNLTDISRLRTSSGNSNSGADRFAGISGTDGCYLDGDVAHEKLINEVTKFSQLPENFGVNQHIPIDNELKERLRSTLWKFKAPIRYAFAYGSGVFSQGQSYQRTKPQVDLIFGVTYSQHWHSLNISQYPDHYSSIRRLGSRAVSYVQDNIGAGVYFNPYVEINGMTVKYGVVSIDTLCRDLLSWDSLYLSGRLHKPVKILRDDPRVRLANQRNLFSVIRTALLLLPKKFTEQELYHTIASISYMGDPRMNVAAENPHKVKNIVDNQKQHFHRLYAPLIDNLPNIEIARGYDGVSDTVTLVQDMDPLRRGNMVARLPSAFRKKLYARYTTILGVDPAQYSTIRAMAKPSSDTSEGTINRTEGSKFDQMIAENDELRAEVARAIEHTVKWPSLAQSIKGLATAGVTKSVRYLGEKFSKAKAGKRSASA